MAQARSPAKTERDIHEFLVQNHVNLGDKDEQLGFFFLHDHDDNQLLCGNELRWMFANLGNESSQIDELVDHAIKEDDQDNDGFISLQEFMQGQAVQQSNQGQGPSSSNNMSIPAELAKIQPIVEALIKNNLVMVFSKSYCPFCTKAKRHLQSKNVQFQAIELDREPNGQEIQSYLLHKTQQRTVPNIFINGHHVGGCDDLLSKDKSGEIDSLLTRIKL